MQCDYKLEAVQNALEDLHASMKVMDQHGANNVLNWD